MSAGALLFVPLGGWQSGLSLFCLLPALLLFKFWREPLLRRLERWQSGKLKRIDAEIGLSVEVNQFGSNRDDYPWQPLFIEMGFVLLISKYYFSKGTFYITEVPLSLWIRMANLYLILPIFLVDNILLCNVIISTL